METLHLTCTAMNRPELFRRMLETLLACGPQGWQLHVGVEPGPEQAAFRAICAAVLPEGSFHVHENRQRLGVNGNPYQLISTRFREGADFVLALEEDLELAPDALALARWYRANHRPHWAALNLLAGACGSAGFLSWPEEPAPLFESRSFNSIGVGLTRADWDRIAPVWNQPPGPGGNGIRDLLSEWGWDWAIFGMVMQDPDLRVIQPVAARCTHAGASGTFCTPEFQERAFARLELAQAAPSGPEGGYRLMSIDALPARIAAHANAQQESAFHLARHVLSTRPKGRLSRWLVDTKRRLRGRN